MKKKRRNAWIVGGFSTILSAILTLIVIKWLHDWLIPSMLMIYLFESAVFVLNSALFLTFQQKRMTLSWYFACGIGFSC
jgi:hypothetical protein